ncbi:ribonuclease Z [Fluviicola taffensis]|uniref:Ribonuclease Z n=1 Tax=Fluviicola taffensis (strain DSM 16823 / NCIMB 13979 / RW262) TaxID=755732 RepID=F2IA85_FLUTR|nr:ribonuclease Z [Fluviicola taffensis]AEA45262.1 Ribonuclease Z [Fluviicola taffensis DSM 16823]
MNFEVTILGSGAALPTSNRNPTAQYVSCNDRHILIDCGEGTQVQLRKYHVHIQKINHILISHLHGDHFFGLVGFLSSMHLLGRDKGLTIYGPEELEQIIRLQLEVGGARLGFELNFVALNGKENRLLFEDKIIEIWTFPLSHRIPTNGFLIKEKPRDRKLNAELFEEAGLSLTLIPKLKQGIDVELDSGEVIYADEYTYPAKPSRSYGYCSDTIYDERIVAYVKHVNLLYHEATFLDDKLDRAKQTFHSTASQAASIAKQAEVGKLLLGHLSARYDNSLKHFEEASAVFKNVRVVEDGETYLI